MTVRPQALRAQQVARPAPCRASEPKPGCRRAQRAGRGAGALAGLAALSALSGCAQPARVNSLATGQPDRVAYELFGHNLADLRAQASQLCPQGGEVLRAAEARQSIAVSPLPALRWAEDKVGRVLPPPGSAQLLVTCDAPGRELLAALPPAPPPVSAPPRKPVFKLGGSDGPGLFSRAGGVLGGVLGGVMGGASGGWWRGQAGTAPAASAPESAKPVGAAAAATTAGKPRAPAPVTGYDD